jgi:tetraacyldisaccharide 4'-kinase
MAFRDRLVAAWYAPRVTWLAALLRPLSWLFGAVVAVRRALYQRGVLPGVRVGRPVVVVGNITVGGAGKTPLVIALAEALVARGRTPGIVSRGHGGRGLHGRGVRAGDDPADVGDEPLLLAATGCPVWIGRDRVAAARGLQEANPACDVLLSDDGLQHYRLERDVEIAVIDATRGLGNGLLLPAGPLREPASRLDDVDAVVHLVAERASAVTTRRPGEFVMTHEAVGLRNLVDPSQVAVPRDWPKGTVHSVAGTGNPQRFFDLLARLGIEAIPHAFPDHHTFVREDLEFPGAQAILMTAKDAVKCSRFVDARCFALDIRAVLDAALVDLVLERIDGRQAA